MSDYTGEQYWAVVAERNRALNRAEKAEDAHQTALAQLSEAVDIIARVEAQVEEWERIAAQPGYSQMRDWAAVHAVQIRAALDEEDCCPCGTCIETIGYDPEVPCPHCSRHPNGRSAGPR